MKINLKSSIFFYYDNAKTPRVVYIIDSLFSLIVISNGTGGNRFSLELAKNGFIVIAPDHWGNMFDNKIPEYFVRYWDSPQDISFLLTSIQANESINLEGKR